MTMTPPPPPGPPPTWNPQPDYSYGPKPANYLVWSILTTLFCCLPFGIASIVYAAKVDSLWNSGDQAGAVEASRNAKKFAIIGASIGVVVFALYFALLIVVGATGTVDQGR